MLDKEIPKMELRKKELEEMMAAGIDDFSKLQEVNVEYQKLLVDLETKTFRWLELSEVVN